MSSTSSQELVASASASSGPACEPSRSARSIPTAAPSLPGTGQLSLFSEMSENLPPQALWPTPTIKGNYNKAGLSAKSGDGLATAVSMSSAAASPARTSARQERAQALQGRAAAYGRTTPELLAMYDPATSSWRTSQLCLDGDLALFSETWPRSGMMRNGIAYRLPPLVPHTGATGYGSLPTHSIPTPTASDHIERRSTSTETLNFATNKSVSLDRFAKQFPTPNAVRFHTPRTTPRSAMEYDGVTPLGNGGLNPTFVEWLMGFPLGWTVLEASATPSSRRSRKS